MIEASGHYDNKIGKPIEIVQIKKDNFGIADFIYSPFEINENNEINEANENNKNKGNNLILNSLFLFLLLIILSI